jgi:hypothetical protein
MPTVRHHQPQTSTELRGWLSVGRRHCGRLLLGIRDRNCRLHEDSMSRAVSQGFALRRWPEPKSNQNPEKHLTPKRMTEVIRETQPSFPV